MPALQDKRTNSQKMDMNAILQRMVETDEVLHKMLKEWPNKLKGVNQT